MRHAKNSTGRKITGFVTDRVIDVIAAVWRGRDASVSNAVCTVAGCGSETIAMVHSSTGPGAGEVLCPAHARSALTWWTGARNLVPARRVTVLEAARIAGDRRADWLACSRCRGTRGPVEFVTWADGVMTHDAQSWCGECWVEVSAGDVSRVMVAQVPPVDQPTSVMDLYEVRAAAGRWSQGVVM